ncbi:uncharacterized protein LOC135502651 [Lineus longissimus]|uniref:uncharacterized protein LOC135502651 n=1 Tax=Lineus longissimus TaxID=88925 RepID=UPI00315DE92B
MIAITMKLLQLSVVPLLMFRGTLELTVTNTISNLRPCLGETITLSCNVDGNATNVIWYKDRHPITRAIFLSYNCLVAAEEYKSRLTNVKCDTNNYDFQLSNVQIWDRGDWGCEADGEEATTKLRLDALVPTLTPAVTNPSPIKVGDTAKFTFNAENENVTKPVTYTWTKNGTTVSPGTKEPVPHNVQVRISKTPVNEHEYVRFECATSGDNPVVIERCQWLWMKSGSTAEQVIQDTATSTQNGKFLEFMRIPYDRSGKYSCKAWILGRIEQASTVLNVQYSPRIDPEAKMKYDVVGDIGKEASFELFIIANPTPATTGYIWSKDDNILSNSSSDYEITSRPMSSKLIIKIVKSSNYDNYTCSVKTSGFQAKVFKFKLLKPENTQTSLLGMNRIGKNKPCIGNK